MMNQLARLMFDDLAVKAAGASQLPCIDELLFGMHKVIDEYKTFCYIARLR